MHDVEESESYIRQGRGRIRIVYDSDGEESGSYKTVHDGEESGSYIYVARDCIIGIKVINVQKQLQCLHGVLLGNYF